MDSRSSQPDFPVPSPGNVSAARAARLRYVSDRQPGIMRRATAGGFVYRDPEGRVIRDAAQLTRNTPAVCRKCYIHPAVLDGYLDGSLRRTLAAVGEEDEPKEMWRIERIVMRFLAERQRAAGPG